MEEIISRLLKKGKLLTPEALEYLKGKNFDEGLVSRLPGIVITQPSIEKTPQVRILKNLTEKKTELSAEDFTQFYNTKLDMIKNIILQKTKKSFVSINKLGKPGEDVNIIGMVKDIRTGEKTVVELEDVTGTAQVIIHDAGGVELDDVIAVSATRRENVLLGRRIVLPDIPLRKPSTGTGKACFVSDLCLNEAPKAEFERFLRWLEKEPIDMLFVAGDIGEKEAFEAAVATRLYDKHVFVIPGEIDKDEDYPQTPMAFGGKGIISLSNPSMVEVGGLNILLVHKMEQSMLKKRYLGRQKQITYSGHLVMDVVPDIVHCGHSHEPQVTNYKSVTIVNSGSLLDRFAPVVIDFETREARTVDISKA